MGILYVVSSGPGGEGYLSADAQKALNDSDIIVSYKKYAKELAHLFEDKELITSGMTKEIQRCSDAIEKAAQGHTVSLISNGDVNVYAMATLVVELIDTKELWDKVELVSLPGVTSMLALASKCGAPVSQDFCLISLSDRLTDIELIQKRVRLSLEADFVMGIYNPMSKKRKRPYELMLEEFSKVESKEAIIASNIGRENEVITYTTTHELVEKGIANEAVGMSTMLLIGNSNTRKTKNGKLLTPRGYLNKYELSGELLKKA